MNQEKLLKNVIKHENEDIPELRSQLDNIANKGTTVEVLTRVTQEELDKKIASGELANMTIEDGALELEKLEYYYKIKPNLINKNDTALLNYDYNSNGLVLVESEGGTVFDIPIEYGKKYYYDKSCFNPSTMFGYFLNEDKTQYLSEFFINNYGNGILNITDERFKFFRCRVANDKLDKAFVSEDNLLELGYVGYGENKIIIKNEKKDLMLAIYSDLLKDSFAKAEELTTVNENLKLKMNELNEKLIINHPEDNVFIQVGNPTTVNPTVFELGYNFKLIPCCNWCEPHLETIIDTTKFSNKPETQINIKGIFKVETFENGKKIVPPSCFINSSWIYPVANTITGKEDVFFIGDSLTDVYDMNNYSKNYVGRLEKMYGCKYNFIPSMAEFGQTTTQQLSALKFFKTYINDMVSDTNKFNFSNVKIVSVFIGTNDYIHNTDLTEFAQKYRELIDTTKEYFPNARMVAIVPYKGNNSTIAINYINKIKEILTEKNIADFVDLSAFSELDTTVNGWNDYYNIGEETSPIHLSAKGWELVFPKIQETFEKAGMTY